MVSRPVGPEGNPRSWCPGFLTPGVAKALPGSEVQGGSRARCDSPLARTLHRVKVGRVWTHQCSPKAMVVAACYDRAIKMLNGWKTMTKYECKRVAKDGFMLSIDSTMLKL